MKEGTEQFSIVVEDAVPADAEAIADIRYQNMLTFLSEKKITTAERENVQEIGQEIEASTEDEYRLVAKEQGRVIGTCQVIWSEQRKRFLLRRFYVRPEERNQPGKRIGTKLLSAVKERSRRSPHASVGLFLNVENWNTDAIEAYRHLGFHETERVAAEDRIRMESDL